ncbi:hypothetical protein TrST_g3084 [Triparma strigata]|uniref:Uncharacterized protein n=1 Tax=Triparma strigata TaxID=1606541 RepID=A0A9W7EQC2_9STRA|nr:hypothetical protein TrST_g3084 [Triparma strigata]
MIRGQYCSDSAPPPAPSRKPYVPSHFVHVPTRTSHPPHVTSLAGEEKEKRLRQVKALNEDKKNLTRSCAQTRTREHTLEVENRKLREDLDKQTRALQVTRKMFGALAEEKNVEQAKALAANAKVSKLESKLGLAIGRTGLAKKNSSLRENVRKLKDDLNDMQQKFKSQEDDLVRACSEIKVLERSLQIKQNELDGSGSGSAVPESGRKPPIREQLLYQLALKKEEEHNLALELAHKSKQLKNNDEEISSLTDQIRNAKIDLSTAEVQVTHMTEQLIQYDLAMKSSNSALKAKEDEVEELLKTVEKLGGENSALMRELSKSTKERELMKKKAAKHEAFVASLKSDFSKEKNDLLRQIQNKSLTIKAAESKLVQELKSRAETNSRMECYDSNERTIISLQSEVSLLRRGIGEESASRKVAEGRAEQLEETVQKLNGVQADMKAEMEATLSDLRRLTRERDAAIQEVVESQKFDRNKGEIERLATSKHLLQKALMEQLGSTKGQLQRERTLRTQLDSYTIYLPFKNLQ